jgi:hypothetical protein
MATTVNRPPGFYGLELTEKNHSSLDLIEKNIAENDSVYVLTEIDTRGGSLSRRS